MDFIGSKYWISYYPSDAQMAWDASVRCSQSSWGAVPPFPEFHCQDTWIEELLQVCLSFQSLTTLPWVCPWDKGKVVQWWWLAISRMSLTDLLFLPVASHSEFCHLRHYKVSCWGAVPLFWDFRGWGFPCVVALASKIRSWQGSPFLTELTNLPLLVDWIEQCCSQSHCFLYDWWLRDINFVYKYLDGQRGWKITEGKKSFISCSYFSPQSDKKLL